MLSVDFLPGGVMVAGVRNGIITVCDSAPDADGEPVCTVVPEEDPTLPPPPVERPPEREPPRTTPETAPTTSGWQARNAPPAPRLWPLACLALVGLALARRRRSRPL